MSALHATAARRSRRAPGLVSRLSYHAPDATVPAGSNPINALAPRSVVRFARDLTPP